MGLRALLLLLAIAAVAQCKSQKEKPAGLERKPAAPLPTGHYCLTAETGAWFARAGRESVFTRAQIDFVIGEAAEDHFHLPFLIAPGGWSTYRGS